MRRRLAVLICGVFLGLGGPSLGHAAENRDAGGASSEQTAASANEEPAATSAASADEEPADDTEAAERALQRKRAAGHTQAAERACRRARAADRRSGAGDTLRLGRRRFERRRCRPELRPGPAEIAVIPQAIPDSAEASNGAGKGNQEAGTSQQVHADAAASSNNGRNEADNVHAGNSGDRGAVGQRSETGAEASAHARDTTAQQGAGAADANERQSADASADARSSDSSNTLLDARIGAPGNDAGFDQSVHAGAIARAEIEGPDGAQQDAGAEARAEAENARNTAVELRIGSDGDSAGGSQTIAADASATATGSSAEASATAALDNPFNTFVSIRINSDGTTGPVSQTVSAQESETVNGTTNERQLEETSVSSWDFDANGIVIHFSSDGSSTDLRISVDDVTLHSPDEAPLFVWEWSMVFGAGSRPDCAITSSVDAVRVLWQFDCDPEDRLAQTAGTATSRRSTHERALLGVELAATAAARVELESQRPGSPAGLWPHLRFPARLPLALARADRGLDRPDSRRRSLHERCRSRRTVERGRRDSHRLRGKRDRAGDDPVGWRAAGSAGGVRDAVRDSAGGGRARRRPKRRCRDRPAGQPGQPGHLRGHRERRGRDRAAARPDAER